MTLLERASAEFKRGLVIDLIALVHAAYEEVYPNGPYLEKSIEALEKIVPELDWVKAAIAKIPEFIDTDEDVQDALLGDGDIADSVANFIHMNDFNERAQQQLVWECYVEMKKEFDLHYLTVLEVFHRNNS